MKSIHSLGKDERDPLTISRQTRRAALRRQADERDAALKQAAKRQRSRAKLDRQTEREKSGFYEGTMSAAMALDAKGSGRLRRRFWR